jgi:hypothetical protein
MYGRSFKAIEDHTLSGNMQTLRWGRGSDNWEDRESEVRLIRRLSPNYIRELKQNNEEHQARHHTQIERKRDRWSKSPQRCGSPQQLTKEEIPCCKSISAKVYKNIKNASIPLNLKGADRWNCIFRLSLQSHFLPFITNGGDIEINQSISLKTQSWIFLKSREEIVSWGGEHNWP